MVWDSCTLIQHLMESSLKGALRQLTPYPTEVCLMEYPFIAALTLRTSRISVGYQTSLCLLFISKTPYCIYRLTKQAQSKGPFYMAKSPLSLSASRRLTYLPSITVERGLSIFILGLVCHLLFFLSIIVVICWAASLTLWPPNQKYNSLGAPSIPLRSL